MRPDPKRCVLFLLTMLLAAPAGAQVTITLRPQATVEAEEIRLGDVADITGSTAQVRSALQQLSVSRFRTDDDTQKIRRSLIGIRLQLEGWPSEAFLLQGADSTVVTQQGPQLLSDVMVEAAALTTIQTLFSVSADEIRVRLSTPYTASLPKSLQQDQQLTVKVLPPLNTRLGSIPMTVQLWRGARLLHTRAGRFDVLRRHQVVVTRTSLPRNHIITDRDVQAESRFLAKAADQFDIAQIVGRRTRATVPSGTMISLRHLQPAQAPQKQQIVRVRDNVHVTAVTGRLKVRLTAAEALQSGRQGDTIRVRNLKSNEIVTGRVTGPGQVEIRL